MFYTNELVFQTGNCAKMRRLHLEGANELEDSHLERILRNARKLEVLDVSCCALLTGQSLAHIRDLGWLRNIRLYFCSGIIHEKLCGLGEFQTLQGLDFRGTQFDIRDIQSLATLKDLRTLLLSDDMDSQSLGTICESFEKLEKLEVGSCEKLTDADGVKFATLRRLKSLRFKKGVGFTDLTFENGLGSSDMESLMLDGCPVTDVGLASIAKHHGLLEALWLSDFARITDAGVKNLLQGEPVLKDFELNACESLTDQCLAELENSCPRLRSFRLCTVPGSRLNLTRLKNRRPFVDVRQIAYLRRNR